MSRFVDLQTNFSTGELDPLMRARVDLEQYNNALAKATNVLASRSRSSMVRTAKKTSPKPLFGLLLHRSTARCKQE